MHFALLREQVRNELGRDPEDAFARFDPRAFAAASLGQVHHAVLENGKRLAVKIQYPGIGRAIRSDFRASPLSCYLCASPGNGNISKPRSKMCARWSSWKPTTSARAKAWRARDLFTEDDSIVVPRHYPELSTRSVLTMQYLNGLHAAQFLAGSPAQAERDRFGTLVFLAMARLHCAGKLLYADPSPGNFLFLQGGRLGLIDFGCVRPYNDWEWHVSRLIDRSIQAGPDAPISFLREFAGLADDEQAPQEQLDLLGSWCRWIWRPYWHAGPFDFGDPRYFREGVDLLARFYSERFSLGAPISVFTTRYSIGFTALLYRLRARVDIGAMYNRERVLAGWGPAS